MRRSRGLPRTWRITGVGTSERQPGSPQESGSLPTQIQWVTSNMEQFKAHDYRPSSGRRPQVASVSNAPLETTTNMENYKGELPERQQGLPRKWQPSTQNSITFTSNMEQFKAHDYTPTRAVRPPQVASVNNANSRDYHEHGELQEWELPERQQGLPRKWQPSTQNSMVIPSNMEQFKAHELHAYPSGTTATGGRAE